jgi:hypothetical protein
MHRFSAVRAKHVAAVLRVSGFNYIDWSFVARHPKFDELIKSPKSAEHATTLASRAREGRPGVSLYLRFYRECGTGLI